MSGRGGELFRAGGEGVWVFGMQGNGRRDGRMDGCISWDVANFIYWFILCGYAGVGGKNWYILKSRLVEIPLVAGRILMI